MAKLNRQRQNPTRHRNKRWREIKEIAEAAGVKPDNKNTYIIPQLTAYVKKKEGFYIENKSESSLINEIMQELGKHAAVYRCNSGSVKLPSGKRFNAMPKGFSDIMAVLPGGRVAFIECKADKGKASPEQEAFITKMQGLGALAGVAYSVSEAMAVCGL